MQETEVINNIAQYAPWLVVAIMFFYQYNIFVTPVKLAERLADLENKLEHKFVLKETYDVTVSEIKTDIAEIKEKIDRMYDKLINA